METINQQLPVEDLQLTAMLPAEMLTAQNQLIAWSGRKQAALLTEAEELKLAYEHAKKMKWRYTTLQAQYNKTKKRAAYYEKMKAALEAGYTIVPNFPVQMFAIRTDKDKPKKYLSTSRWHEPKRDVQECSELDMTVGDYKNPRP